MAKFNEDLTEVDYKDSVLFKSPTIGNCWHCGDLTYWIDMTLLAYLCSEECSDAKWDEYLKMQGEYAK